MLLSNVLTNFSAAGQSAWAAAREAASSEQRVASRDAQSRDEPTRTVGEDIALMSGARDGAPPCDAPTTSQPQPRVFR